MNETAEAAPEYDGLAMKGPLYHAAAAVVGAPYVDKNIRTWEAMQIVLDSGEHRPTHLRATKPSPEDGA